MVVLQPNTLPDSIPVENYVNVTCEFRL